MNFVCVIVYITTLILLDNIFIATTKKTSSELSFHIMVLILDGNSEIGAHVRSKPCYLICLRHLIRSKAVSKRIFSISKNTYFPSCVHYMFCVTI